MIYAANLSCNIRTNSHVSNPRRNIDITIPEFKAVLDVKSAELLGKHLLEAVEKAKVIEQEMSIKNG